MPQVTFETVWDTSKFNSLWPSGAANPFVWSFEGSPTGYGTHADYMFGWKGDALQRAMDKSECFYDGCGSIKKQQMSVANQCTVKDFVGEQTDGCTLPKLIVMLLPLLTYNRAETAAGHGDGIVGSWYGWSIHESFIVSCCDVPSLCSSHITLFVSNFDMLISSLIPLLAQCKSIRCTIMLVILSCFETALASTGCCYMNCTEVYQLRTT
jgi:hypothetical protein